MTATNQLADVKEALSTAERDLKAVEEAAPHAALRLHTGKAQDGDQDLLDCLQPLRKQVDELRLAVVAAEQVEAERVAKERYVRDQARQRAASQHLGAVEKNAEKAARAAVDLQNAFEAMVTAGQSAIAVLPRQLGLAAELTASPLHQGYLGRLVRAELCRLSRNGTANIVDPSAWIKDLERPNGELMPFLVKITEMVDGLKIQAGHYAVSDPTPVAGLTGAVAFPSAAVDGTGGVVADPSPVAAPLVAEPSPEAPPVEPAPLTSPQNPKNVIDLRGKDLGVEPDNATQLEEEAV